MVIDGCVQLEPIEPASRTLATGSDPGKDPVARDAQVIAYGKQAGIENGNAGTTAFELVEQGTQGHSTTPHQLNTAVIAWQDGKLGPEKPERIGQIKALELPAAQLMMVSILVRLPTVEDRVVPGHWQAALIKGAGNKSSAVMLVERISRPVLLACVEDATAASALAGFTAKLNAVGAPLRQSLTYNKARK